MDKVEYNEAFEIISKSGYNWQICNEGDGFLGVLSLKKGYLNSYYILPQIKCKDFPSLVLKMVEFAEENTSE